MISLLIPVYLAGLVFTYCKCLDYYLSKNTDVELNTAVTAAVLAGLFWPILLVVTTIVWIYKLIR